MDISVATLVQDNPPLSASLTDRIAEGIATGDFPPGAKLDETELAERFGVSRTPVREALIQLGSAGLVTLRPRRGAFVTAISPLQLVEMFDVMAELEAYCARLAARRATDEEKAALRSLHLACQSEAKDNAADAYYLKNESFHHALYRLSHNAFLGEQALQLSKRLRPFRRLQLRVRARIMSSYQEHSAVVEAICAGDEEAAARAIRGHVTVQGERFGDLMRSMLGGMAS